jgi:uncharacterized protein (UPF0335 family)
VCKDLERVYIEQKEIAESAKALDETLKISEFDEKGRKTGEKIRRKDQRKRDRKDRGF